eukprot:jgi/Botrbrau1/5760/Bobra.0134s0029.1
MQLAQVNNGVGCLHKTLVASDNTFNMPRARSSCVAKPNTRVPIGCPLLLIRTQAFFAKRSTLPSFLLNSFLVSVMTALCIWPAPTFPFGAAFLTVTVIVSPTLHNLPVWLMHSTTLAPELSDTCTRNCILVNKQIK